MSELRIDRGRGGRGEDRSTREEGGDDCVDHVVSRVQESSAREDEKWKMNPSGLDLAKISVVTSPEFFFEFSKGFARSFMNGFRTSRDGARVTLARPGIPGGRSGDPTLVR